MHYRQDPDFFWRDGIGNNIRELGYYKLPCPFYPSCSTYMRMITQLLD